MNLSAESIVLIIGAISGLSVSIVTIIKTGSAAYNASVDKAAKQIENQRLVDQANATVEAKNAEIFALQVALNAKSLEHEETKHENARLWEMIPAREDQT